MEQNHRNGLEIAIIGMSCKFPKSNNTDEYWANISNGRECIDFLTEEELRKLGIDEEAINDPNYVRAGARIDGEALFDADFFGYTPNEAEIIDPQQRVFLECAWTALEDAGYSSSYPHNNIGVYAGENMNTYMLHILRDKDTLYKITDNILAEIGNDKDYLALRVAYKLGLTGPAVTLQTACSTSLVAIHTACRALLSGECDMAIAGGVCIRVPQIKGYYYYEGNIFSADGHCRTFDAKAQGTVFGNGVGVLVLKSLEDAIRDGDSIHAVIKSSAVNNDGANKVGFTAPSLDQQADAIHMAQALADIDVNSISYMEAHGTGTLIGDPIEVAALTKAFRKYTDNKQFCAIGSVKSNMGHLAVASGVAGIIKVVMALKHRKIPASINFESPNPNIDFENSPFYVNTELKDWNIHENNPRRAGVSSFGIGGTNAHIIIEEYEKNHIEKPRANKGVDDKHRIVNVSAHTRKALKDYIANLTTYVDKNIHELDMDDFVYTLGVGRQSFRYRFSTLIRNKEELQDKLRDEHLDNHIQYVNETPKSVVLLLPGQGSQYINMGKELYNNYSIFRENVDYCLDYIEQKHHFQLRHVLYPDDKGSYNIDLINQTNYTQPLLFIIEYALASLLEHLGIVPDITIGHSVGEYVAATLAGVFSLDDALTIMIKRSQLMYELYGGDMVTIAKPYNEVSEILEEGISIAAINAPNITVVSGSYEKMGLFKQKLDTLEWFYKTLHTSHAFHSTMMEEIEEELYHCLDNIELNYPNRAFMSNVTGELADPEYVMTPQYWVDHMLRPVQFLHNIIHLPIDNDRVYIEAGPGNVLSQLVTRTVDKNEKIIHTLSSPKSSKSDMECFQYGMARMWEIGLPVDFSRLYDNQNQELKRLSLPTYPFQRKRYWIDTKQKDYRGEDDHRNIQDFLYVPTWKKIDENQIYDKKIQHNGNKVVVVFGVHTNTYNKIVELLVKEGLSIIQIVPREGYNRLSPTEIEMDYRCEKHYEQLFDYLNTTYDAIDNIIIGCSLGSEYKNLCNHTTYETYLNDCYFHPFYVLRYYTKHYNEKPMNLVFLIDYAYIVTGNETRYNFSKSIVNGIHTVATQEYPSIHTKIIDIDEIEGIKDDELVYDIMDNRSSRKIAYRHKQRYELGYVSLNNGETKSFKVRKDGTYIITGGLGDIGFVFGKYLTHKAKINLIIIGRTVLPPKGEYDNWLEKHEEEDKISQLIHRIKELEYLGSQVYYYSADVADYDTMNTILEQVEYDYKTINGIIHCAGIYSSGDIQTASTLRMRKVLDTKIKGTLVFENYLRKEETDFYVLCSSLSGILGGIGNTDYCAANAFLDAFANYCSHVYKIHTLSINWDEWQQIGMAERLKKAPLNK